MKKHRSDFRFPITFVWFTLCLASPFTQETNTNIALARKNVRTTIPTASRLGISSQDLDIVLSNGMIPQETMLWLDLRQNSIHPKSAIEQLEMQTGLASFVDRILLSETVFQNLIDFNDMYLTTNRILYQSSQNNEIFLSSNHGLSTPFGNVVSAPSDVAAVPVGDPIYALELISSGKWVLLEKREGGMDDQAESLRIDAVGNFLDIVFASSEIDGMDYGSQTSSGLVLPTTGSAEAGRSDIDFGGVAVACDTKSEVMKLASMLQLKQDRGTKAMTESGIMLQSNSDPTTATTTATATIDTAVVLPFAVDSWEIAAMVFGKGFYEEDSDESE